jgi:haloacetate dehalogenase
MGIPGFTTSRRQVGATSYLLSEGGADGPPLLLLHGFPETHLCWRRVAPALSDRFAVVAVDLRGYGASHAPPGGSEGRGYTKREMAAELVALMAAIGHERFAVVGHDRGARVAYRLALDRPDAVDRVAIVNAVPTVEQFERMGASPSLGFWPWFLLAQPPDLPERLLAAERAAIVDHVFATWAGDPAAIGPDVRAAYVEAMGPETIAGMCGDYRASFHADRAHDAADRAAGRRIRAPLLVVAGAEEEQLADAPAVWARWAEDVTAITVPGGHFVPEEAPDALAAHLRAFLA